MAKWLKGYCPNCKKTALKHEHKCTACGEWTTQVYTKEGDDKK